MNASVEYNKRTVTIRSAASGDGRVEVGDDGTPLEREEQEREDHDVRPEGRKPSAVSRFLQASLVPLNVLAKLVTLRAVRLGLFVAVGALLSFLRRGTPKSAPPQEVLYSDFLQLCSSGNVKTVRFEQGSSRLLFDVKESIAKESSASNQAGDHASTSPTASSTKLARQFYTRQIPDPTLITTLRDNGVTFGTVKPTFGAAVGKILFTALALWVPLIPM